MIDNLFNTISRFSISSLFDEYLFNTNPCQIQLRDRQYAIYPLGLLSGVKFHNAIASRIFDKIQIEYFKNPLNKSIVTNIFDNIDFLNEMIQIIDDIYVFDEDKSLYSMLQSCSIKQLKYLFYTIRNQNFVFINKRSNSQYSLSSISYAISELDKILYEYNQFKKKSKDLATIDVNATEYAEVSVETISIDYTTQFYKDYIIGEELFYNIISKGYTCRFISLIENIPTILNNNDPTFQCKINNSPCIQSCRFFDPLCNRRIIRNGSYQPFKAIYVLPQLISLMKSKNREIDVDNLIRGVLYSISASFGDRSNLKSFHKFNHNDSIQNLIDKNKFVVTESLFPSLDIKTVENNIRESLGLSEMKEESIVNLIDILRKIYTFIDTNKMTFTLGNIDKLEIINDVLENHIKKAIIDYDYTSNRIVISNEQDFSDFVSSVGKNILFLDNMLMKFPNDILGIDSMISNALKDIRASKTEMAKHGQVFIDPRETLLTSESILFKRIAVDENLYAYYKENNRTKLINNILFWKWSIALSYQTGVFLELSDDHPFQTMNFNEF